MTSSVGRSEQLMPIAERDGRCHGASQTLEGKFLHVQDTSRHSHRRGSFHRSCRGGTHRHFLTKKKLTCSGRATDSSCWRCRRHGSGSERLDRDCIAEIGQTFDQALFLPIGGTSIEVIAAEVLVHRAVFEHVVDGSKDRGRNGQ
jgi:hypothetical protein